MNCNVLLLLTILLVAIACSGQETISADKQTTQSVQSPWAMHSIETKASLRGLHVFSSEIVWASGTGGTLVNSTDGGKSWHVVTIPGAEKLDVRDIHAIDEATVIAMTSGTPARIYRSSDAGLNWKVVFESSEEAVFLDSLSFLDYQTGIVMGDPIDEHLMLLKTMDGGMTWQQLENTLATQPGEAGFAASGTNMQVLGGNKLMIGLGGGLPDQPVAHSRIVFSDDLASWIVAEVPIPRLQSAGIFSIGFANEQDGVVVGGDYLKAEETEGNFALTRDGGKTWSVPDERKPPSGYRSCVAVWHNANEVDFVTVGPNGTDLSSDLGKTWNRVSEEGFHAIQFSPDGQSGWATGGDGRIAKWVGPKK